MDKPVTGSRTLTASIVLCTRNRGDRLRAALAAIAAMTVPDDVSWECLVVDNGSSDGTRDVAGEFVTRFPGLFCYTFEPRPGKTFALNRGLDEARGELLAFTDDDAIVQVDWLAAIVRAVKSHDADGVGGKVLPLWESPPPGWLTPEFHNVLALLDLGDAPLRVACKTDPRMLYGVNFAFRRSVFDRLGKFNTILGSRGEDQELFDRIVSAGLRVFYDPSIVVSHMISRDRLAIDYYERWYRDTGASRALLVAAGSRQMLGIPLYVIRQALESLVKRVATIAGSDQAVRLRARFNWIYYRSFIRARLGTRLARDPHTSP